MAAMSGKIVQNVFVSQCYQPNRKTQIQLHRDCFPPYVRNLLPFKGGKLAWSALSSMHLHNSSNHTWGLATRGIIQCNVGPSSTLLPYLDKVEFLKLQNGSDIRGVAVSGVEGEPVNLTEPVAEAIGAAFVAWLVEKKKADPSQRLRVSVGHDSRISAQMLQDSISRGIASSGLDVIQYGLASTPAMFNSTLTEDDAFLCPVDGSIMITASHLPYNRNGFKFFTSAGGLGKPDIKDILERASNVYTKFTAEGLMTSKGIASTSIKKVDYMTVYTLNLVKAVRKAAGNIEKPLEAFHIVVDAGNGAGGFFAAKVLEPLGAVTSGSQFLEPDGLFPNHIPNPEDKTAMRAITKAVLENKADLGIIFDTDVDRSAAVDSTGREFNRNRLIALMSAIVLEEHPGTTIVTDSVTSQFNSAVSAKLEEDELQILTQSRMEEEEPPLAVQIDQTFEPSSHKQSSSSEPSNDDVAVGVTVITGYLGAGKSTLVNYILNAQHGKRIAVILNEFGEEVGVERAMINEGDGGALVEEWVELANGCICCTVKHSLVQALEQLVQMKERLDHILIETTGLANPAPLASVLWLDDQLESTVKLDSIVTVVDAKNLRFQLNEHRTSSSFAEAYSQIAFADVIILNKVDLIHGNGGTLEELEKEIHNINALANIIRTVRCEVDLSKILDCQAYDATRNSHLEELLQESRYLSTQNLHDSDVRTLCINEPLQVDLDKVRLWLEEVLWDKNYDMDVYRCKGVLSIRNSNQLHILQGVKEIYEIVPTRDWKKEENQTNRVVFIGHNLDEKILRESFRACVAS